MRIKHQLGGGHLLATSGAVFVLLVGLMLFAPSISQPAASAVEDNSAISTYSTTPTVGISLPTSIDFADVLPTPSGATTTATADLTITTTDSAGYSLYLYSSDGDNRLKHKISSLANISQINATAGDVGLTLSSLEPNTWGYNLGTEAPTDTTTYSAVPTNNSTPIQTKDTSDTNSANDTYTLSFGAKVDSTIASGAYSNALTVAVTAEPRAIVYIQDLTLSDCQSRASDADFTVTDRRDDNDYTVRYINGACWMTQNLRLSGGQTLTSEDSNVVGSWEFPNNSLTLGNSYTEARSAISADPEYALEYGGPGRSAVHPQRKTPPKTSARRAGDCQPTVNKVALLEPVTYPPSRLSIVTTTTMARSAVPAPTAAGGRLLRTVAPTSTTCTTSMVACIPTTSTTTSSAGSQYGVSALPPAHSPSILTATAPLAATPLLSKSQLVTPPP